jgi:hypothetical protein
VREEILLAEGVLGEPPEEAGLTDFGVADEEESKYVIANIHTIY